MKANGTTKSKATASAASSNAPSSKPSTKPWAKPHQMPKIRLLEFAFCTLEEKPKTPGYDVGSLRFYRERGVGEALLKLSSVWGYYPGDEVVGAWEMRGDQEVRFRRGWEVVFEQ